MQGRVYSVIISAAAATANVDLFEVNVAATKMVEILELHVSQQTEIADAGEEALQIVIKTGMTSSGSGGTAPTAIPRFIGDAAYAGTVEVMNTTKSSGGTIVTHESHGWNIRLPFVRIWTPDSTLWIPPSGRFAVEQLVTPADSITYNGTLIFREYG